MSLETGALARVGVGDVFMTPFRVLFGAVHGACTPGGVPLPVEPGLAGAFSKTSNICAAETAKDISTFGAVNAEYAATRGMPIGGKLSHMSKALASNPRAMLVAGGVVILGGLAVALGAKLASHATNLISKGIRSGGDIPDGINSSGFHLARAFSGVGLVAGGILCLVPGGAALGVPLIATSGVTSAGLGIARWSQQPDNFIQCPNILLDNPLTMPIGMVGRAFNETPI